MDVYPWVVFVHVVGGFTFALAHGASSAVALQLRGERDLSRVRALLDLSRAASGVMYLGLIVLLLAGVLAGFLGGLWGRGWLWAALAVLVGLSLFMYIRASGYYGRLRRAAGQEWFDGRRPHPAEPADEAALATLLAKGPVMEIAVVGYAGLVVLLWLMLVKPF